MQKTIFYLTALTLILYLTLAAFLYFNQSNLLYHPTPKVENNFEKIVFKDKSDTTVAYVLNPNQQKALIAFGGNNDSMANVAKIYKDKFKDYTIYLLDYRGYGLSSGKPSQEAIFKDALKLYDFVSKKHKTIDTIGRSLGTAVAIYVASKRDVNKVVLVTPFDSILDIAKERYWFLPVSLLVKDKYLSKNYAKDIKAKVLILVAKNDKIVSLKRTQNLIKALKDKDIKVVTLNHGHNDIVEDPKYYEIINSFLKD